MKSTFYIFFLILSVFCSYAQDMKDISELEFKTPEDYKLQEDKVLQAASYVLSVPINDTQRLLALQAITKWMSGTPHYTFEIDNTIADLMKKNDEVFGLYMASMTRFVLEQNGKELTKEEIKLNTYQILLDYCGKKENRVTITKDLKKAINAKNNGKLKEYLKG